MKKQTLLIFLFLLLNHILMAQFTQTNGPEGGGISCIERVGNEIWSGSNSGIYRSTNEGITWQLSSLVGNHRIFDIYASGDSVWVLYTPEMSFAGTDYNVFVARSFDAGQTWNTPYQLGTFMTTDGEEIQRVQNTLFVRVNSYSKYNSTDFGLTWTDFIPPNNTFSEVSKANDPKSMLLLMTDYNVTPYTEYLYVSNDGLQTWQLIHSSTDNIENLYINDSLIIMTKYDYTVNPPQNKLYRSVDLGQTWAYIDTVPTGFYFQNSELYPDSLYGSTSSSSSLIYWQSLDSGATWNPYPKNVYFSNPVLVNNGTSVLHIDYLGVERYIINLDTSYISSTGIREHGISAIGANNGILYAATYTRVFKSNDGGNTWTDIPALGNNTYTIRDFYFSGDTIFTYSSDSFYRSYDNGQTWQSNPLNGYVNSNSPFANLVRIGNTFYRSSEFDSIYKSVDWGFTWQAIASLSNSGITFQHGGYLATYQNTLFAIAESGEILKYNDQLNTWSSSYTQSQTTGAYTNNRIYNLNGVLVASNNYWQMYCSTDGGTTWHHPQGLGLPIGNGGDTIFPRYLVYHNGMWIGSTPHRGFFTSIDSGNHWTALQSSAPFPFYNASFTMLNDIVYSASYFSSVWRSNGSISLVTGKVYYDMNDNGQQDIGEYALPNMLVEGEMLGIYALTDANGDYSLVSLSANDTLSPIMPNIATHSNPQYVLSTGQNQTQNFGIYIPPSVSDMRIDMTNNSAFTPGMNTYITLNCQNVGTLNQAGSVKLIKDNHLFVISSNPPANSQVGDTLIWQLPSLTYGQVVTLSVLVNTENTLIPGLDSIFCIANIFANNTDAYPSNNEAKFREPVVGAYDPNEKVCNFGEQVSTTQIADSQEFVYIIRFQNLGNAPTNFVHIADTLSPFLDVSSFHILGSSHPMTYSLSGNGILDFKFNPLSLPPASINEAESHGFVKYAIRGKNDTHLGAGITNTAYIYFDFNSAIVTNTTSTLVVLANEQALPIEEQTPNTLKMCTLYPNPANDELFIRLEDGYFLGGNISLYDEMGRKVREMNLQQELSTWNMSDLNSGLYVAILKNHKGEFAQAVKILIRH